MKRIYVAGNYSRNAKGETANVIEVLENMHTGISICNRLLGIGFHVFCPWLDFQFGLTGIYEITKEIYIANSMSWLEVSDAVLAISGVGLGSSVDNEINRADELEIPVFYSIEGLVAAREDKKRKQ